MEDQPVNNTETEVADEAMGEQQDSEAVESEVLDPETSAEVTAKLREYVDKLKETENEDMVSMAVLNIQFENLRRTMAMSGAPEPLLDEYLRVMQVSLDMIGHLINIEEIGTERFISIRNDIISKGDEIAKAVLSSK